jgi:hypothetical protein
MPEAPVNEYCPFPRTIRDIGRSWKIAVADAETMSLRVKELADRQLRGSTVLANLAEPRRGGRIEFERWYLLS